METHEQIDKRSLLLAHKIVEKVDSNNVPNMLTDAKSTCQRWMQSSNLPVLGEWIQILNRPWSEVRAVLLDESEEGQRLRQSNPFCKVLTPEERREIYKACNETA